MGERIGIIGGTGPHGRGLALRFALAGHEVLVGSRDEARAAEVVAGLEDATGRVSGSTNLDAATAAQIVVITVPVEAQASLLPPLAAPAAGKVVVSCGNPLSFDQDGPHPVPHPHGSAAQEVAALLPDARVVGAFQNLSAVKLQRLHDRLAGDVLLTGDDSTAKATVAELVEELPELRALDAGPLRLSGPVEAMTPVLLSLNKRYKGHGSIAVVGLARR